MPLTAPLTLVDAALCGSVLALSRLPVRVLLRRGANSAIARVALAMGMHRASQR